MAEKDHRKVEELETRLGKCHELVSTTETSMSSANADYETESNAASFSSGTSGNTSQQPQLSKAEIIQHLSGIKEEFSCIMKEVQAIKDTQKEAMLLFQSELMKTMAVLQQIQLQDVPPPTETQNVATIDNIVNEN
ncbi:PREDICTED: uncharacterized protein LOC106815825 [Priapulus caudatus]|uniref:Uncharacterized protein LOC106815825 n=1 Tax=Priapulus caudatus TaxID=37621 RepID=A0ABM1EUF8_PRICU|nr:PREDICTED: uncharacterized protein LOC106815825 [Priapulus caudatus]